jgi:Zn-dependent peptidase ImmA (M78 family)
VAYESGDTEPSGSTLAGLSRALGFPADFFFAPEPLTLDPSTVSFRSLARLSASTRDAALGASAIAVMLNTWIEARFDLPETDLPDLRDHNPETAADMLRQHWGLGERPIKNMVHLLEAKGIRLYSLAEQSEDTDALSFWYAGTPFIFLNLRKSGERGRFDAAHELGHLVLHRHGGPTGQEAEKEAHAFASAFLMPRASVLAIAPRLPTVEQILQFKKYWIVSAFALVYRMQQLGLMSDWHYRYLCRELSTLGYRSHERDGIERESSQLLAGIFAELRKDGITKHQVAKDLFIETEELDKQIFGLVMTAMAGGNNPSTKETKPVELKIIKGSSHGGRPQ